MSLSTFFGFKLPAGNSDLPEIFPLEMKQSEFVQTDIINIYTKILTDVMERTSGLKDDQQSLLWDNCVASENSSGLISMISKAMADQKELFIIYDPALKLIREAKNDETSSIREDYKSKGSSPTGVFISFKNYKRSEMVKLYSSLEYCTVSALSKEMNLSKAIQLKMKNLRSSVALSDSETARSQAQSIAEGLSQGKDILLDSEDTIETADPNMQPIKEAISFLNQKRSFYLGLPEAYINGIQTGGMGTSGENDTKAIERGLKNYFFSIVKPVIYSIFQVEIKYKSQDFRMIDQGLKALQTFSLIEDELITLDQKKQIINDLFDFEHEGAKGE